MRDKRDAVAALQAKRIQAGGQRADARAEIAVAPVDDEIGGGVVGSRRRFRFAVRRQGGLWFGAAVGSGV